RGVGGEQPGQDVRAVGQVGHAAPVGDLGVDQPVDVGFELFEAPPGTEPVQPRVEPAQEDQRPDPDEPGQQWTQPGQPGLIGDAEDDAQDDVQADLVEVRVQRERPTGRPAGQVLGG